MCLARYNRVVRNHGWLIKVLFAALVWASELVLVSMEKRRSKCLRDLVNIEFAIFNKCIVRLDVMLNLLNISTEEQT